MQDTTICKNLIDLEVAECNQLIKDIQNKINSSNRTNYEDAISYYNNKVAEAKVIVNAIIQNIENI